MQLQAKICLFLFIKLNNFFSSISFVQQAYLKVLKNSIVLNSLTYFDMSSVQWASILSIYGIIAFLIAILLLTIGCVIFHLYKKIVECVRWKFDHAISRALCMFKTFSKANKILWNTYLQNGWISSVVSSSLFFIKWAKKYPQTLTPFWAKATTSDPNSVLIVFTTLSFFSQIRSGASEK